MFKLVMILAYFMPCINNASVFIVRILLQYNDGYLEE